MKIDTLTNKIFDICNDPDLSANAKIGTILYFTRIFVRQRQEYLENKESKEPEALGTGSV